MALSKGAIVSDFEKPAIWYTRTPFEQWSWYDLCLKLKEVAGEWRGEAILDCIEHTEHSGDRRWLMQSAIERLWGGDDVETILDDCLFLVVCDEERIPF